MRHPEQGSTGGWVMPSLYSYGFLCVSSHYLILPRISSLVAQSLGVSAPTPKAQGLILFPVKQYQFSPVAQSCLTLCDPMNRSTPGLPVHHQLPEFTQTHVHRLSDAI